MDKTCYMICELKVDTKSPGWQRTITRMIKRVTEVSYKIDAQTGVATISGRINPKTLLKLLEKIGKHAQLINVDSGSSEPYESAPPMDEVNTYPQNYGYYSSAPVPHPPPVPQMGNYYYDHYEPQCSIM